MGDRLVNRLVNESCGSQLAAEIYQESGGYKIHYMVNGNVVKEENFSGSSIQYVEDTAENWLNGVKSING